MASSASASDEPAVGVERKSLNAMMLGCLKQPATAKDPDQESADVVHVVPDWVGWKMLPKDEYDLIVYQPTPEHRWWTRMGWPKDVSFSGGRPRDLLPTEPNVPSDFFIPESEALGELKVELLETEGLPKQDGPAGKNDVYSVLVFEESIARTKAISNVDSPRWHAGCARAFKFPVFAPHSSLFVALFDSDEDDAINTINGVGRLIDRFDEYTSTHLEALNRTALGKERRKSVDDLLATSPSADPQRVADEKKLLAASELAVGSSSGENIKTDDAIGRVVIDLRDLQSGVVYDSWFELRASSVIDDRGKLGALRMRYSLTWRVSQRRLLLRYLSTPPEFVIPLGSRQLAKAADFALRGLHASKSGEGTTAASVRAHDPALEQLLQGKDFDLKTFVAHARECKEIMYAMMGMVDSVRGLFTYERPLRSLLALALWQAVCTYPNLLPSCAPLSLLAVLHSTRSSAQAKLSPATAPPASRKSQEDIVRERAEAAEREVKRELDEAALADAFESALKGGLAEQVASTVGGAVNSLAHEIVGRRAMDYWAQDVGRNAKNTIVGAGRILVQEGKIIEATTAVTTRAAKVATRTVATAAKAGVNAVRLVANTAQSVYHGMTERVTDPTIAFEGLFAYYLKSVQATLASTLSTLRGLRSILNWTDPLLTAILAVVLVVLVAVLPFLPWRLICHAAGFLALGPHMWLIGRQQRSAAVAINGTAERVKRFSRTTDARERMEILEEERRYRVRKDLEEKHAEREAAKLLPLAAYVQRRRDYSELLQRQAARDHCAELRLQGSRVVHEKLGHEPDASRSYVRSQEFL